MNLNVYNLLSHIIANSKLIATKALQTFMCVCVCMCMSLVNMRFAQIILKMNNKLCSYNS